MAGTEAVSKATVRIYLNFRSVKVHSHSNILFRLIQDIGLKAIYIFFGKSTKNRQPRGGSQLGGIGNVNNKLRKQSDAMAATFFGTFIGIELT